MGATPTSTSAVIRAFSLTRLVRYTCDASGQPTNSTYSGTACGGSAVASVAMPLNCQNNGTYGYLYSCQTLGANPNPGFMRVTDYADAQCNGVINMFVQAADGACVGSFGESFKVQCDAASGTCVLSPV